MVSSPIKTVTSKYVEKGTELGMKYTTTVKGVTIPSPLQVHVRI